MKLTVAKEQIVEGLQKAANVIPSRTGAAYLRSVWLKAENGTVSVMATDANIEFTGTYAASIAEDGLVGVQGRAFIDLVRQLPAGELKLTAEQDSSTLFLEQGKRKYKLPVNDPAWFQPFFQFPDNDAIEWSGDFLQELLDKVSFCIGDNDAADAITCLCLKPVGDGRIDVCGLNGHQFAIVSFTHDELAARLPEAGLLIQKKHLQELKKWLGSDAIELHISEKVLHLRTMDKRETLTLPIAAYTYPNYNVFMEKVQGDNVSHLSIDRKECMDALGRIAIFTENNCAYLTLHETEMNISAQDKEVGSADESIEAQYKGDIDRIAFPSRQLMEILGHFTSASIEFIFTGVEGPCCISGPDDPEYKVIIMPMKIADTTFYNEEEV